METFHDSSRNFPPRPGTKGNRKTGLVEAKHRKLAALIARGVSVSLAAEQAGLSQSRAYHLLADRNSTVNSEIERVQSEMFQALDALLLNLYRKALDELESLLESGNPRTVLRAVNLIIRLFLERSINFDSPVMKEIFGGLK